MTLTNVESVNPWHLGVHGGGTTDAVVKDSIFTGSSQRIGAGSGEGVGWEDGAMKLVKGTNLTITGNHIENGYGPGIWFDIDINGGLIAGNTVIDHTAEGIFVEISRNVTVRNNTVLRSPTGNNDGRMSWLYGSGILISTSYNIIVENNLVDGSYHGITVIDQSGRSDTPPGFNAAAYTIQNNTVRNVNKVGAAQDSGSQAVYNGTWTGNTYENVREFVGVSPN